MNNHDQDNLSDLFERFMPPSEAEQAVEEIRAGDEMLRHYPAPEPDDEMILGLKLQIVTRLSGRRRNVHRLYRLAASIAAIIVLALIALHNQALHSDSGLSHAALVPTFIWESDDISTDDVDLAYFNAEIEQIEAQVRALETGESQDDGVRAMDEVEMELVRINAAFWKE